jgi:CRP/FNR family transcriptional regulator
MAGEDNLVCSNIISGLLKVTAQTGDGREQTVGMLFPGDFVGHPYEGLVRFSVLALTHSTLCVFPREALRNLLAEHRDLERLFLFRALTALDEARDRMLMLSRRTAEERVAGLLLDMANHTNARAYDQTVTFELPLSRGQIANILGITIETVCRQLTRLRKMHVIDVARGRSIIAIDCERLAKLAGV